MDKTRCLVGFLAVLIATPAGFSQSSGTNRGPDARPHPSQQSTISPAPGWTRDARTGLPTRIVHKPSGIVLVLIPAGEFLMGLAEGEPGKIARDRRHRRIIRKPFYLGETEVTVGQFRRFVRATGYETDAERGTQENDKLGPGAFASTPQGDRSWNIAASWRNPFPNLKDYRLRDDHPVVQVSWNDARRYCEHFGLQLPTEAQWEYAYRAGSCERFPWGDDEAGGEGYGNVVDQTHKKRFPSANLWFPFDDGAALIAPVGRYRANAWGLRDMVGNVQEWCQDALNTYPGDGADETAAPGGDGSSRAMRGGLWLGAPENCRSAARFFFAPQGRRDFIGFRVALSTNL